MELPTGNWALYSTEITRGRYVCARASKTQRSAVSAVQGSVEVRNLQLTRLFQRKRVALQAKLLQIHSPMSMLT